LNKIQYTYALLLVGAVSLSLFANSAYAQQPGGPVGGLPVPVDSSGLLVTLMENNVLWVAAAGVAGVVIYKIRPNKK
jgi:hypothetical protein